MGSPELGPAAAGRPILLGKLLGSGLGSGPGAVAVWMAWAAGWKTGSTGSWRMGTTGANPGKTTRWRGGVPLRRSRRRLLPPCPPDHGAPWRPSPVVEATGLVPAPLQTPRPTPSPRTIGRRRAASACPVGSGPRRSRAARPRIPSGSRPRSHLRSRPDPVAPCPVPPAGAWTSDPVHFSTGSGGRGVPTLNSVPFRLPSLRNP